MDNPTIKSLQTDIKNYFGDDYIEIYSVNDDDRMIPVTVDFVGIEDKVQNVGQNLGYSRSYKLGDGVFMSRKNIKQVLYGKESFVDASPENLKMFFANFEIKYTPEEAFEQADIRVEFYVNSVKDVA